MTHDTCIAEKKKVFRERVENEGIYIYLMKYIYGFIHIIAMCVQVSVLLGAERVGCVCMRPQAFSPANILNVIIRL